MFHVEMPESGEIPRKTKSQLLWIKTIFGISLARNVEVGGKIMFLFIRKLNLYLWFTEKQQLIHNCVFNMNVIVGIRRENKRKNIAIVYQQHIIS